METEARKALTKGKTLVVIDRTNLSKEQRNHFLRISNEANVTAHVIVFDPPKEVITKRVRERKNHVGGVMGDDGVRIAMQAFHRLEKPTYEEGIRLISSASTPFEVRRLANLYRGVGQNIDLQIPNERQIEKNLAIPFISWGTMGISPLSVKTVLTSVTSSEISTLGPIGLDTAPTYKNEEAIGDALKSASKETPLFLTAKIPKSVTTAEGVRQELQKTLTKLQRSHVDLLLLHWPSGALVEVWKEMEKCLDLGLCRALGVCNFNVFALVGYPVSFFWTRNVKYCYFVA